MHLIIFYGVKIKFFKVKREKKEIMKIKLLLLCSIILLTTSCATSQPGGISCQGGRDREAVDRIWPGVGKTRAPGARN